MVAKLLCLSIWMSVSIFAMEEGQQALPTSEVAKKDKMPKFRTTRDDDSNAERIRSTAFKEGLMVGRKENEENIRVLQAEQKLLLQVMSSKLQMEVQLSNDLQQSREQLQMFENALREITEKFHKIIIVDADFKIHPIKQVIALQDALEELKKLIS